MSTMTKAFCWATAIIAVAFAGRAELISSDSAQTLTFVLPALAVATLYQARTCTMACLQGKRA